jgi:cytochrome c oxidase cbb3-type subunit 2
LDVYRANGCAYCHSQQVGQTGTVCDVVLNEIGTNPPALFAALGKLKGMSEPEARQLVSGLPKTILAGKAKEEADAATKALNATGAKAQLWIVAVGPDISRPGWGVRRSVAEDFLFDYPVMLGSQRIGPDLANVGVRLPDPNWHLLHLYAPQAMNKGSMMAPYPYLFEKRKIERFPSPDALVLPPQMAAEPGFEVIPTPQATALAAYLVSLRADIPLFSAPVTVASAPVPASTNAPAGSSSATNALPTNTPAK